MKRKGGVDHHENNDEILENTEVDQVDADQSDVDDKEEECEAHEGEGEDLPDNVSELQDASDVDVSDSEADSVMKDLRLARTLERNANIRAKTLVTELQEEGYLTE